MVHRLGVNPDVVLLGGMARDIGFETALDRKLGIKVFIPQFPDFAGALGAALIAVGRVKVRPK
jgi:activator of 2-hydroxyglutaryl-CoA dehydratase